MINFNQNHRYYVKGLMVTYRIFVCRSIFKRKKNCLLLQKTERKHSPNSTARVGLLLILHFSYAWYWLTWTIKANLFEVYLKVFLPIHFGEFQRNLRQSCAPLPLSIERKTGLWCGWVREGLCSPVLSVFFLLKSLCLVTWYGFTG